MSDKKKNMMNLLMFPGLVAGMSNYTTKEPVVKETIYSETKDGDLNVFDSGIINNTGTEKNDRDETKENWH
jgi:hypothetical protein